MAAFEVSRTLVKSPPEVWAELERAERLAELLGDDAIKITRAQPETTIEWQGSTASGTIEIGASGWGTKVRLTAEAADPPEIRPVETEAAEVETESATTTEPVTGADAAVGIVPEAEYDAAPAEPDPAERDRPDAEPRRSLWRRFKDAFSFEPPATEPQPPAEAVAEPVPDREPEYKPEPRPDPEPDRMPEAVSEPKPATAPDAADTGLNADADAARPVDYESLLTAVLDHLGSAHKRPFTAT